jgi:type IV secretory pathway protease TraF
MTWKPATLTGVILTVLSLGLSAPRWVPSVLAYGPSTSLPKGWYVRAFPARPLRVGDLVVLDVPDRMQDYVATDVRHPRLLKQVAAVGGMTACWGIEAMTVRGTHGWYPFHPLAPAVRHDLGCWVLAPDEVVLVGTHARSFDSRYMGPVSTTLVQWRALPVWTWPGEEREQGGAHARGG